MRCAQVTIARSFVIAVAVAAATTMLFAHKNRIVTGDAVHQQGESVALFQPAVAEWQLLETGTTPPSESACYAAGRRCFSPSAMQNAYNVSALYAEGFTGAGTTIAVMDSFGSARKDPGAPDGRPARFMT